MKDIRYLRGVGEARAKLFAKKNIYTIEDLLYFFPRDYEDRTIIKSIEDTVDGETVCIRATVFSPVRERKIRKNLAVYTLSLHDETGGIYSVWYNNRFLKDQFIPGEQYVFYGRISEKNGKKEIGSPIFEKEGADKYTGKIVPLYPLTGTLTQKMIQSVMELAIKEAGQINEIFPKCLREQYEIAEINYAIKNIHFPESFNDYEIARKRFVFEELLILQLALALKKNKILKEQGYIFENTNCINELLKELPFTLTNAQKNALNEVLADMQKTNPMNRLVQGDVGSGKTVVAAGAMYVAVKNGYQSAIMAPTEILARQHFETFSEFFKGMNVNIVLLTGSMKAKEKRLVNSSISCGFANIIIGTHAIIQNSVEYNNLGLVVTDEQHRFGVSQRATLVGKGTTPHVLIMTATPIPRTLALILYGDLDVSIIDELPPGRKPVKTYAVGEDMRERIYEFLKKNILSGAQAYIVCPLIEETEDMDLQNAEALAKKLADIYPEFKVGLLHGKMRPALKDAVMEAFVSGDIKVLVSTTVIEVGVNVPNANIMIIENAERFGLSQLHQLRGRVGRGDKQSYCILFAHGKLDVTKKRMKTMCESNDGFYISEQDLKLRGPGDFFGVRQHGLPEMKIANLFEDITILKDAQKAAEEIMDNNKIFDDSYKLLKEKVENVFTNEIVMN